MDIKKAWNRLLPVPLIEAFALPDTVEQTTLEPTPNMNITLPNGELILMGTSLHRLRHSHTHGHLPLLSS